MAQQAPEGGEPRAEGRIRGFPAQALTLHAPTGDTTGAHRDAPGTHTHKSGGTMPDIAGIAGERLRSLIERIERLEEEKRTLGADIKEVYAEAKGTGFDTKIMRQIIRIRRMDKDDLDEQETLLDIYKRALGMLPDAA